MNAFLIWKFFSILQIDFKLPIHLWRQNRRDFIAWFICLVVCLVTDVEIGLMCGIVLNVLHLIYMWARPETVVRIDELDGMQYIHVIPNVGMFFPGIDHLRETVNKAASAAEYKVPAVIDCTKFNGLDYTSAQVDIILMSNFHLGLIDQFTKLNYYRYHFRVSLVWPTICTRRSKHLFCKI